MEILDEDHLEEIDIPLFRRLFLYFIYSLIISIGIYWNATQSFTVIWLPYDFGMSGGCYIELPSILTVGFGGVLMGSILLKKGKISLRVLLKALILVLTSASISFFIITYFKLINYIPLSLLYAEKMDLCHGALHFLFFILLIEVYITRKEE